MKPVRFGQVAALKGLNRENAKLLKSPNNRILYCPTDERTYMVTGAEDMGLVDELTTARNQAEQVTDSDTMAAKRVAVLSNGLLRFLINRASQGQALYKTDYGCIGCALDEYYSKSHIELL